MNRKSSPRLFSQPQGLDLSPKIYYQNPLSPYSSNNAPIIPPTVNERYDYDTRNTLQRANSFNFFPVSTERFRSNTCPDESLLEPSYSGYNPTLPQPIIDPYWENRRILTADVIRDTTVTKLQQLLSQYNANVTFTDNGTSYHLIIIFTDAVSIQAAYNNFNGMSVNDEYVHFDIPTSLAQPPENYRSFPINSQRSYSETHLLNPQANEYCPTPDYHLTRAQSEIYYDSASDHSPQRPSATSNLLPSSDYSNEYFVLSPTYYEGDMSPSYTNNSVFPSSPSLNGEYNSDWNNYKMYVNNPMPVMQRRGSEHVNGSITASGRVRTSHSESDTSCYTLNISRVENGEDRRTTLMIRNIPNKYSQVMLLNEINTNYKGTYDFFYLPIDFKNNCNVGYAFINFIKPTTIVKFFKEFNKRKWSRFNSEKICELKYGRRQGKDALINHFRHSSVINVDEKYRPLLFHSNGVNAGEPEMFPAGI